MIGNSNRALGRRLNSKFVELVDALNKSPMRERSLRIDKGQGGYWSKVVERAARSFENYVVHKMKQGGMENDYLANVVSPDDFLRDADVYPYLLDKEIAPIAEAFDNLFGEVKTRETDKGLELFQMQEADPLTPKTVLGGHQQLQPEYMPEGNMWDAHYWDAVKPLVDMMQKNAIESENKPLAFGDLDPAAQVEVRKYIKKIKGQMATLKNSTKRWGGVVRDDALLDYRRRTLGGRYVDMIAPYRFWTTENMWKWTQRAVDKPWLMSNAARLSKMRNTYQNNEPERNRNKFKIPMPFLPDWMGDALYVDPLRTMWPPSVLMSPFDQMQKNQASTQNNAVYVLREWAKTGKYTEQQIQEAMSTQAGPIWELALQQAGEEFNADRTMFDTLSTIGLSPALYLSLPYYLATKKGGKISQLPITRQAGGIQTALKGTSFEGMGNMIGALAEPERWLRKKFNIPEYGQWTDFYIDRQLANMAADGTHDVDEIRQAMIERQGPIFEEALERVRQEQMLKTPGTLALQQAAQGNFGNVPGALIAQGLIPASIMPEGEKELLGLKSEYNNAWNKYNAGDKTAINQFFEDYPEYQARVDMRKEPDERLQSFLVGEIWDKYFELDRYQRSQAATQLGDLFETSFLDPETRDTNGVDTQTLAVWARLLNGMVPQTEKTAPIKDIPQNQFPQLELSPEYISSQVSTYRDIRDEKYPNWYTLQQGYYNLPQSERRSYALKNPELTSYWDWNRQYKAQHPDVAAEIERNQVAQINFEDWNPLIMQQLIAYGLYRKPLTPGAMAELRRVWEQAGRPNNQLGAWLDAAVVPALMTSGGQ